LRYILPVDCNRQSFFLEPLATAFWARLAGHEPGYFLFQVLAVGFAEQTLEMRQYPFERFAAYVFFASVKDGVLDGFAKALNGSSTENGAYGPIHGSASGNT
jgi:hypothetical protein